jgi:hypothetical protein
MTLSAMDLLTSTPVLLVSKQKFCLDAAKHRSSLETQLQGLVFRSQLETGHTIL